jgi:hypothetical protein
MLFGARSAASRDLLAIARPPARRNLANILAMMDFKSMFARII